MDRIDALYALKALTIPQFSELLFHCSFKQREFPGGLTHDQQVVYFLEQFEEQADGLKRIAHALDRLSAAEQPSQGTSAVAASSRTVARRIETALVLESIVPDSGKRPMKALVSPLPSPADESKGLPIPQVPQPEIDFSITRSSLRELLQELFGDVIQLDAFVMDFFPNVMYRVSPDADFFHV